MVKRFLFGILGAASFSYAWNGTVALWLGRYDQVTWEVENPEVPAPPGNSGPYRVRVVDTRRVVPSEGMNPDVNVQNANNNLHAVRHTDGRVYLAWRSAPTHFASEFAEIIVASSEDEKNWRNEASFSMSTDLREPQLASLNGRLHLYVSKLGANAFDFAPAGVYVATRSESGVWSKLSELGLPGQIAWSVRSQGSFALMSAYKGGENMYALFPEPLSVNLLASSDGVSFRPWYPGSAPFYQGGASETDFAVTDSGSFLTVMRNEAGDATGFGSIVCERARPKAGVAPICRSDPRKFDSPRLFRFARETYLIARRNVTDTGVFDQPPGFFNRGPLRRGVNQLKYIVERKRCSVWHYVAQEQRFTFELDLPSRGDTCFASILRGSNPSEVVVYDYSSDIQGPDVPWTVGQRSPTFIYRHVLDFHPPP
ncbi:MAG: hypothetical protein SFV15_08645 [Polyangiaceae bacterium]|nr:hypothetical protein [Polyangiaceae bacterium]